jgi:hypothetical protein
MRARANGWACAVRLIVSGLQVALALDPHFEDEGFGLLP